LWTVSALLAMGCEGPDEVTCELKVGGVDICLDQASKRYCEKEYGGIATDAELEPGGPYAYCEDLYDVSCSGSVVEKGDNFTASMPYYAASEEDCAASDGKVIGE
jgi:hypothetical protein